MTETKSSAQAGTGRGVGARDSGSGGDRPGWATAWPLARADWGHLALALAVVVSFGVALGEILTNWSALTGLIDLDDEIAQNLADGRTDGATELAQWGAFIADTPVKIALSIAIAGFFVWRFRRWHEAVMVGLPLIFEATAFIVITFIVKRPRPDVERLLDSPVDSSFPSGHVAAATVYAAIAVVVFWHSRAIWARALAAGLAIAAPIIVAWARMYQGMHYFTDVIGGIALGAVSVAIAVRVLGRPPAQHHPDQHRSDQHRSDQHRSDQHLSDQRPSDRQHLDQHIEESL